MRFSYHEAATLTLRSSQPYTRPSELKVPSFEVSLGARSSVRQTYISLYSAKQRRPHAFTYLFSEDDTGFRTKPLVRQLCASTGLEALNSSRSTKLAAPKRASLVSVWLTRKSRLTSRNTLIFLKPSRSKTRGQHVLPFPIARLFWFFQLA